MRVLVSFNVDENRFLNLENTRKNPENMEFTTFEENVIQAFEKLADLSRSTPLIQAAINNENNAGVIKFSIPVIFQPNLNE